MGFFNLGKAKSMMKTGKKINNKGFLKATVGMAVATAYADGGADDAELITMETLIANDENLSAFSDAEIKKEIDTASKSFGVSFMVGNLTVQKHVKGLAGDEEKEMAFAISLAVAGADGDIDDKEVKVLKGFASILGLSPSKFGL